MNYVELLINKPSNAKLDLDSEVNIGLQYSIADIRDISKRNSAYSKTIILPGTKNNNYWMGNLFDVNADFTGFNPNRKTDARLLVNSETVIDGFLQLRKINKLINADMQGNLIQYEIVIYNNAVDFMTELGESTINELDLSEFGHTFSIDSITDSWDNTYSDGYVYPMYGGRYTPGIYDADWFWPSMFYYTLLDRTLFEAGFGWTGSLKTNQQFRNEIIAYVADGRPKIPEEERRRRLFQTGYTASTLIEMGTFSGGTPQINSAPQQSSGQFNYVDGGGGGTINGKLMTLDDDFTSPNFDNGPDNWDTTTFEWEIDRNGIYGGEFVFEGTMELYNAGTQSALLYYEGALDLNQVAFIDYRTEFRVMIEDQNGIESLWPASYTIGPTHRYQSGYTVFGNLIEIDGFTISAGATKTINTAANWTNNYQGNATFSVSFQLQDQSAILPISSKIKIRAKIGRRSSQQAGTFNASSYWNADLQVRLRATDNTYFKNTAQTSELTQGDYLDLAGYLPDKVKQKDLIKDLITRYNLYISVDPDNDKLLIMDTRPDYYDAGEVLDWTDKKDFSSEDNIELLSELQFKEMLFTWKKDDDDDNKAYTAATGDIYGQFEYIFDNDFVKGVKKVESPFSPTPMIKNSNIDAYLPSIDMESPKIKPRILYWGGLKDTDPIGGAWSIDYIDTTNGLSGTWNNSSINNQYPYAGHFDDPLTPTLDINFGTCKYYFYNDYTYLTNNNMFNTYWLDYAKQIEGGRLVTSKFDLNEVDIRYIKENFNSKIFVLDSYYYVNKIIDYNPLKNKVTTVELIKIVEGLAWEGQIFAGDNTVDPGLTAAPGPVRPTRPSWPVKPVRPTRPHKDWGFGNDAGYGGFIPGGNNNKSGGYYYSERVTTDWILDCGAWNDEGFWRDTSFWRDTQAEAGCGVIYKNMNLQFMFGDNNELTANQNYVFGDRNFLGGSNLSVIGGSDNYITTNNVTLIQSQGLTVTEANTVYLGNSFSVNINSGDVVMGSVRLPYISVEESYDILTTDYYVTTEGQDTAIVLTLPEGDDIGEGKQLHIKNLCYPGINIIVQTYNETTGTAEPIDTFQNNAGWLQVDTSTAHGYATGSYIQISGSPQYSGPYQIISIESTLLFTVDEYYTTGGIVGGETVIEIDYIELIDDYKTGNGFPRITLTPNDSIALVTREGSDKQSGWIII